jgi:hypothetical protein
VGSLRATLWRHENFKSQFHCSGNDFELIEIEPLIIRCNSPRSLFVTCYSPFANINRIMVLPSLMFGIVAAISLCHALPHNFQRGFLMLESATLYLPTFPFAKLTVFTLQIPPGAEVASSRLD